MKVRVNRTSHMRLLALGSQLGIPILAIHCSLRSRFVGKLLNENPLVVELLQPGTQQPAITRVELIDRTIIVLRNVNSGIPTCPSARRRTFDVLASEIYQWISIMDSAYARIQRKERNRARSVIL